MAGDPDDVRNDTGLPATRDGPVILCLHLGAHKTATSLVQARLAALRGRVGGRRFLYIDNRDLKAAIWARWCRGRPHDGDPVADFASTVAGWRAASAGVVVVSAEDFLGGTALFDGRGLYPEAGERLGRFAELLAAHPDVSVRPLLHIREQTGFLAAAAAQETVKGRRIRRRGVKHLDPSRFSWGDLVETIEARLGVRVAVREFGSIRRLGGTGYVADMLEAFGLPEPTRIERSIALGGLADRVPEPLLRRLRLGFLRRRNPSLSARGMALAEAMRPHFEGADWNAVARPFLARHFSAADGDATQPLPDFVARRFAGLYERDLVRLGPRLLFRHPPIGSRSSEE